MFLKKIKKNTRVKIIIKNNKILKGVVLGYDKHMNLILDECEEYRPKYEKAAWEFRKIGFCCLRGDLIILISKDFSKG